jgi:hypothetical protein
MIRSKEWCQHPILVVPVVGPLVLERQSALTMTTHSYQNSADPSTASLPPLLGAGSSSSNDNDDDAHDVFDVVVLGG